MKTKTTIKYELNKEIELPQDFIESIPMQGQADTFVAEVKQDYIVECSLEDSKAYLKNFGAWSDDELNNLDSNIDRLIWISCLDCQEQKTTYFYMGE